MNYLSVSEDYPASLRGGTEAFAHRLNLTLSNRGVDVCAAYYGAAGKQDETTEFEGVKCRPLVGELSKQNRLDKWAMVPLGLDSFTTLIERIKPAIVHFHGLSSKLSPDHIRVARDLGSKTVLTYHAPGQSCQRWDLLYDGQNVCDGKIQVTRCTACALRRLGVPASASHLFSSSDLSALAPFFPGPFGHVLERRQGTQRFASRWAEATGLLDLVTYHSSWVRELLLRNSVSPEKTLLLPLPPPRNSAPVPKPDLWSHAKPTDKKVLYAGRLIDIKGVHILLEALTKYLPKEKVSLLLIGANGPADYQERIRSMVEKDPRILLIPTQQEPTVMAAIAAADAVVVPSLWPETGPYAVLEALYMKKYIVGANRAGIAERLNGINGGCLYDPHNACELAEALQRALSQERSGRQNFSIQSYESSYESAVSKLIAAASSTGPSIGEADRLNG